MQTTTALIHKVGEDGKGLAGAEFTLYKDESCTQEQEVIKIGPTDSSGNAKSKIFHPTQDTYYLKETKQPTSYPAQPDKVYKVSVQDGKATAGIEYTETVNVGIVVSLFEGRLRPFQHGVINVSSKKALLGPHSSRVISFDLFLVNVLNVDSIF